MPAYLAGRMELALGGYGVGYRGMCRFRSGPIFMQPVMKSFDYAARMEVEKGSKHVIHHSLDPQEPEILGRWL